MCEIIRVRLRIFGEILGVPLRIFGEILRVPNRISGEILRVDIYLHFIYIYKTTKGRGLKTVPGRRTEPG